MAEQHVLTALRHGSPAAARLIAKEWIDSGASGHQLRALATAQPWNENGLTEDLDELLGTSAPRAGGAGARTHEELRALRDWAGQQTITVVWSSYGHRFHSENGNESCFTCGALFEVVHDEADNPQHGAYQSRDGAEPTECLGDSKEHGEAPCTECEDGSCEACQHPCNCLLCTG